MKKRINAAYVVSIIIVFITIGISIFTAFQLKLSQSKLKEYKKLIEETRSSGRERIGLTIESENLSLNGDLKLVNIEGDTVLAKDVFKKDAVILRYSVLNCDLCVKTEIEILEQIKDSIGNDFYFICYYENVRGFAYDYNNFLKKGLHQINFYRIVGDKLDIPIDEYNIPYYFNIDTNLKVNNFFVPKKEDTLLTKYYLKYSFKNMFNIELKEF